MASTNLHVDNEAIKQAVLAAWKDLDLKMIELGLKPVPEEPPQTE